MRVTFPYAKLYVLIFFTKSVTDYDTLNQPILLHLCHPFALQNLIKALEHVKALRSYIGSLPAGGEHAKVAQVVLVDAVDCSGVNFGDLLLLLGESFESAQQLGRELQIYIYSSLCLNICI